MHISSKSHSSVSTMAIPVWPRKFGKSTPQRHQERMILFGTKQELYFLERNKNDPFLKLVQNKNDAFWNVTRTILFGNWNKIKMIFLKMGKSCSNVPNVLEGLPLIGHSMDFSLQD